MCDGHPRIKDWFFRTVKTRNQTRFFFFSNRKKFWQILAKCEKICQIISTSDVRKHRISVSETMMSTKYLKQHIVIYSNKWMKNWNDSNLLTSIFLSIIWLIIMAGYSLFWRILATLLENFSKCWNHEFWDFAKVCQNF